jgi:NADH dehydrogenase
MARRRPDVVIVGAGWGGLTMARRLRSVPVDVTLIDRNNYRVFSPIVYQVASGMLSPGDIAPSVRILILDTVRARFTALINWAALFLFREPPLRIEVSAERRAAAD